MLRQKILPMLSKKMASHPALFFLQKAAGLRILRTGDRNSMRLWAVTAIEE